MARKQLSIDSYNKDDTLYAQQILNRLGGYGLVEDGIYGKKTQAAVKKFQKANGLTADGILGKNTWAALTAATTEQDSTYDSLLKDVKQQQAALSGLENPFDAYDARLQDLLQQMQQRQFSYDMESDPLYQQYRAQYSRQGQLAMEDTMGAAAALTGGYGNSYAATAGQQAYQDYVQKLGQVMPELYSMALDRFQAEGDSLESRYESLLKEAKFAQSAYETQLKNHQDALNALYKRLEKLKG